jgi:hypothetical protein
MIKYTENTVHQVGFIYKILHECSFAVHMQNIRRGNNATESSLKEYPATRVLRERPTQYEPVGGGGGANERFSIVQKSNKKRFFSDQV